MTVIVAGLTLMMALVFGGFVRDLGVASARRAQAELAADAAALAAAAESGPYGAGLQPHEARRYAERNGARLVACECPVGASYAQVRVAVGGVVADARAVLDPRSLLPAPAPATVSGLVPALADAVQRLLDASGGRIRLVSGYRSGHAQSQLWARALQRYGTEDAADDWVARPGHSMHERGLAVDLGGDLDLAVRLISDLGLPMWRPLANEPWHFELVGSR